MIDMMREVQFERIIGLAFLSSLFGVFCGIVLHQFCVNLKRNLRIMKDTDRGVVVRYPDVIRRM